MKLILLPVFAALTCFPLDMKRTKSITNIAKWGHPTKTVFQKAGYVLDSVVLYNSTYPQFRVRNGNEKLSSTEFLKAVGEANGFWNYSIYYNHGNISVSLDRLMKKANLIDIHSFSDNRYWNAYFSDNLFAKLSVTEFDTGGLALNIAAPRYDTTYSLDSRAASLLEIYWLGDSENYSEYLLVMNPIYHDTSYFYQIVSLGASQAVFSPIFGELADSVSLISLNNASISMAVYEGNEKGSWSWSH